jgi:O-antigen/teichoic acid export membrane protein
LLTRAAGSRRTVAGIADQVLVAVTSACTGLLATAVLPPTAAGLTLYAMLVLYFVQGVGRACVGDVMLTHVARFESPADRRRQFQNAHATIAVLSVVAMLVLLGIWEFGPQSSVGALVWGIPFVPSLLLQDLARYTYQTQGQQAKALVIDACWVLAQVASVVIALAVGLRTGGALLACWGIGATVGAAVFYARTRINPLRGRPLRWVRDTRHLMGWFTATGILGQIHTLLVGSLVKGFLTVDAFAGFRLVQTLVLQPSQSLAMALNGLLVPRSSRLAGARDTAGIRRQTQLVLAVAVGIGVVVVTVAATLGHPVLHWYKHGEYAFVAPIAVPIAIQAWIFIMQVPFTVAIRGMHRGWSLFVQYALYSGTALAGLCVGAQTGGLLGAVWGLVSGAGVGLAVQAVMFVLAYRALARVPAEVPKGEPVLAGG